MGVCSLSSAQVFLWRNGERAGCQLAPSELCAHMCALFASAGLISAAGCSATLTMQLLKSLRTHVGDTWCQELAVFPAALLER